MGVNIFYLLCLLLWIFFFFSTFQSFLQFLLFIYMIGTRHASIGWSTRPRRWITNSFQSLLTCCTSVFVFVCLCGMSFSFGWHWKLALAPLKNLHFNLANIFSQTFYLLHVGNVCINENVERMIAGVWLPRAIVIVSIPFWTCTSAYFIHSNPVRVRNFCSLQFLRGIKKL